MATVIPLKIRVDIRDLWDSPKSSVQQSANSLAKTLGHKIVPQAQWPALWNELGDLFPDKSTFVPTISRTVIAWYERLLWRLDCDSFPEWTEECLSVLAQAAKKGPIELQIEPSPASRALLQTSWREKTGSFYLGIPKTQPASQTNLVSMFDKSFENILAPVDKATPNEDRWVDVKEEVPPPVSRTAHSAGGKTSPRVERLPVLAELSRPHELFTTTAPYILTVDAGTNKFVVRSSHEPSLELLAAYLNKWGKTNVNDSLKRNILKVELVDSVFCFGVVDALFIEPYLNLDNRGIALNPTIVLAFIEGVLGYKLVHTTGHSWMYRCDAILRS